MNSIFNEARKFEGPVHVDNLCNTAPEAEAADLMKQLPLLLSHAFTLSAANSQDGLFTDLMKQLTLSLTRAFTLLAPISRDGSLAVAPQAGKHHDLTDLMKQFTLSLSRAFTLSAPNSHDGPLAVAHNNNVFTFSATSSSSSAAPKAVIPDFTCAIKKFKASPPSRRSATSTFTAPNAQLQDFDKKFTNLMEQFPRSSGTFSFSAPSAPADEGFLKVNDNISTLKATDDDKIVTHTIYDFLCPSCQSPEFVVPPRIKEFCEWALEKYNNEKGTIYKYTCPIWCYEKTKAHNTSHYFSFTATIPGFRYLVTTSDSCDIGSKTFIAEFKSGSRFSEGIMSYFKEIERVYPASCPPS